MPSRSPLVDPVAEANRRWREAAGKQADLPRMVQWAAIQGAIHPPKRIGLAPAWLRRMFERQSRNG